LVLTMELKKYILAAVLFTLVAMVVHAIGAVVEMPYYTMPEYLPMWSKIMMPETGPPPAVFYVISAGFSLVGSLVYVCTYGILKKSVPGKGYLKKGLSYGAMLFLISGLPGSLSMALLTNLPLPLIADWAAEMLVVFLVGGVITAKIEED